MKAIDDPTLARTGRDVSKPVVIIVIIVRRDRRTLIICSCAVPPPGRIAALFNYGSTFHGESLTVYMNE